MLQTELETSTDVPNRTDIARAQHLQPDQHQPPPYRHHHLMRTVHASQRTGASPSPYPHRTLVTPSSHLITTTPPGKMGDLGLPLLSRLAKHPDMASNKTPGSLQAPPELSKGTTRPRHEGPVSKKSAKKRRFNMEQWRDRYMVVDGTAFCYWHSVDDYEKGVLPSKGNVYGLQGYHVLIDPEDSKWGFTIKPLAGNKPTFEFRADTEPERVQWVTAFVSACLLAVDEDQFGGMQNFRSGGSTDFGMGASFFDGDEDGEHGGHPSGGSSMNGASDGSAARAMVGSAPSGPTFV